MTVISGTTIIVLKNGLRLKITKMAKPNAYAQYNFQILEKSQALGADVTVAQGRLCLQPRVWIKPRRVPNPSNRDAHKDRDYIDDPSFPQELLVYGKDSLNSQIQDAIIETLGISVACKNDIEPVDPDEAKAEDKASEETPEEENGGMGHDLDSEDIPEEAGEEG